MSKFIERFIKPSRAARRLVSGRQRGSVLILCVVLIVVLALMGTAMLSGTRIDRYTTQQHSYNTQIDLLVEGAKQVAKSELARDLYDTTTTTPVYRQVREQSNPAGAGTLENQYEHHDGYHIVPAGAPAPTQPYDAWLASLVPRRMGTTTTDWVFWDAITGPLTSASWEDPRFGPPPPATPVDQRSHMVPTLKTIAYPDGTQQTFPAMWTIGPTGMLVGPDPMNAAEPYIAADADGDGIADSMLCRLIPGELNGVTWYAGMRIVDNAAKVNVNTAMSKEFDFDSTTPHGTLLPPERFTRYYTSSVGLLEMLQSYPPSPVTDTRDLGTELVELLKYRTGNGTTLMPHGVVLGPTQQAPPPGQQALGSDGNPRGDFAYLSFGGAMDAGLSRRIGNPGYASTTPPPVGLQQWVPNDPLGRGDMAQLAAGFTLLKPGVSASALESALNLSLIAHAANGTLGSRNGLIRYNPNQAIPWFADSFLADDELVPPPPDVSMFRPLRPLLATHNPVANWAPQHDLNLPFPMGVIDPDNRCAFQDQLLAANVNKMPDYPIGTGTGTPPPGQVARTDANTARFGELWRAYWNVMVDQSDFIPPGAPAGSTRVGTPFVQTIPAAFYPQLLYSGNRFDAGGVPQTNQNMGVGAMEDHPQQMFRSSIRDHRPTAVGGPPVPTLYLEPSEQLLLRAALAAVNTEDLRDANAEITRRDIQLRVFNTATPASPVNALVSVYGLERQPFITEVYVNTDDRYMNVGAPANPKGYVAIELYNPYPVDINLTGWAFAVLDRRDPSDAPTNVYPNLGTLGKQGLSYFYLHGGIPSTTDTGVVTPPWTVPFNPANPPVVPANGYLILENYPGPLGAAGDIEAAASRPEDLMIPATAETLYVPNLHWVVRDRNAATAGYPEDANTFKERRGGELVILQPRSAGGNPLLTDPDTVPVDSFDFTGLLSAERYAELGGRQMFAWHYVRSNNTGTGPNWKFVYPGRYAGDNTGVTARHQGTVERVWVEPNKDPDGDSPNLGVADGGATYLTQHTIQLGADGFPGPHAVVPGMPAKPPFGGFARNGDLLQVPYIGSYRVSFVGDTDSVLELNAVTMDSCFANDCDAGMTSNDEQPTDDGTQSREQVGRFAPIRDRTAPTPMPGPYDDLDPDGDFYGDSTSTRNKWRYRWAIDLFDYLTVNSPGNDYLPNVPTTEPPYAPTPPPPSGVAREPVDNDSSDGKAPGGVDTPLPPTVPEQAPGAEDAVPFQGLININTAPWSVLAAVPWMPVGDLWTYNPAAAELTRWTPGPDMEEDNVTLAKAIVRWRDGRPIAPPASTTAEPPNGPFTSPFDLYRLPDFVELQTKIVTDPMLPAGPDDKEGDFSPFNPTPGTPNADTVRHDFEEQYLLLNRVSNLLTTRSDSYTVYLIVQGWRNTGTATPELVAQRRVAFIQERHPVTPADPALPPPYVVPND